MNIIKCAAAALLCALVLTGCGQRAPEIPSPLEELPADYSLERAKADGCVVHEDGDISSGQEIWDAFVKAVSAGKTASVRLVKYYTLGDPSRYDPEYYESVKDDYPMLYVSNLSFDGKTYTVTSLEDGERREQIYSYLKNSRKRPRPPMRSMTPISGMSWLTMTPSPGNSSCTARSAPSTETISPFLPYIQTISITIQNPNKEATHRNLQGGYPL